MRLILTLLALSVATAAFADESCIGLFRQALGPVQAELLPYSDALATIRSRLDTARGPRFDNQTVFHPWAKVRLEILREVQGRLAAISDSLAGSPDGAPAISAIKLASAALDRAALRFSRAADAIYFNPDSGVARDWEREGLAEMREALRLLSGDAP